MTIYLIRHPYRVFVDSNTMCTISRQIYTIEFSNCGSAQTRFVDAGNIIRTPIRHPHRVFVYSDTIWFRSHTDRYYVCQIRLVDTSNIITIIIRYPHKVFVDSNTMWPKSHNERYRYYVCQIRLVDTGNIVGILIRHPDIVARNRLFYALRYEKRRN